MSWPRTQIKTSLIKPGIGRELKFGIEETIDMPILNKITSILTPVHNSNSIHFTELHNNYLDISTVWNKLESISNGVGFQNVSK